MKLISKLAQKIINQKTKTITLILCLTSMLFGCDFFEAPTGTAELLDVYTRSESEYIDKLSFWSGGTSGGSVKKEEVTTVTYICTTVKITNTSDKNIYNTTINVQAKAGDRTYYKTVSLDVTIEPGNSIYIPIEIEKNTRDLKNVKDDNDAAWDLNSIKIISVSWR